jgi:3-oxoacyl-[acyl-carrier protein] reductase
MIDQNSLQISKFGHQPTTVLITGASGGIGTAVAKRLFLEDTILLLQYRSQKRGLERAFTKNEKESGKIKFLQFDLSNRMSAEQLGNFATEAQTTVWVHSVSSSIHVAPALYQKEEELQKQLDSQVFSALTLSKTIIESMQRKQQGCVIFLLSTAIISKVRKWWNYIIVKQALVGLHHGLANDVSGSGIRIVGVMPGAVDTHLVHNLDIEKDTMLSPETVAEVITDIVFNPQKFPNGSVALLDVGKPLRLGKVDFVGNEVKKQ